MDTVLVSKEPTDSFEKVAAVLELVAGLVSNVEPGGVLEFSEHEAGGLYYVLALAAENFREAIRLLNACEKRERSGRGQNL